MSKFELAITGTLANEGDKYIAEDNGRGPSKYGITLETYREHHPDATAADIANLNPTTAAAFYKAEFWDPYHYDQINDQTLANKVFDIGVNDGPETSIRFLQLAVASLPTDGILGPKTIAIVNSYNPTRTLGYYRMVANQHYRQLVMKDPTKAKDLAGWLARVAK